VPEGYNIDHNIASCQVPSEDLWHYMFSPISNSLENSKESSITS